MITRAARPCLAAAGISVCLVSLAACGSAEATAAKPKTADKSQPSDAALKGSGDPRCDSTVKGREFSEYDTSGDEISDVRKVFVRIGDANTSRLVLICREADVNHDGIKDVVRIYDDDGRPVREVADRNFDSKSDQSTTYQSGEIVVQEFDNNFDGKTDTKLFYNKGKPIRAERDMAGRSTATQWHADRWEYYDGAKMVRMGTDLDGDGKVDHWDRDAAWKRAQDAARAKAAVESTAD
jgi:hypothetical protein